MAEVEEGPSDLAVGEAEPVGRTGQEEPVALEGRAVRRAREVAEEAEVAAGAGPRVRSGAPDPEAVEAVEEGQTGQRGKSRRLRPLRQPERRGKEGERACGGT